MLVEILSFISIFIAFVWLSRETNGLSIRLPMGAKSNGMKLLNPGKVETILALPKSSYQPSQFTPCDLEQPEITSKTVVNIGAKIL